MDENTSPQSSPEHNEPVPPAKPSKPEWSRKQKRGYQRVRSLLWFWEAHHFQVLWVTLSTAEGGQADKLTYHHKQLRQRIERQLGYCQGSPKFPQLWSSKIPHLG